MKKNVEDQVSNEDLNLRFKQIIQDRVQQKISQLLASDEFKEQIEKLLPVLEHLQDDTLDEFVKGFLQEEEGVTDLDKVEFTNEMLVFLLLSNTLNNLDRKIEKLTSMAAGHKPKGEMLDAVSNNRGLSGNGLSYRDTISAIKSLAEKLSINTSLWEGIFDRAFLAQKAGMETLLRSNESNQPYSIQEAIDYRIGTLGNYFALLVSLIPQDRRKNFLLDVRFEQLLDDIEDILEDVKAQINPFVALLKAHDLFDEYVKGTIDVITYGSRESDFGRDRKNIYIGYWEMVGHAAEVVGVNLD